MSETTTFTTEPENRLTIEELKEISTRARAAFEEMSEQGRLAVVSIDYFGACLDAFNLIVMADVPLNVPAIEARTVGARVARTWYAAKFAGYDRQERTLLEAAEARIRGGHRHAFTFDGRFGVRRCDCGVEFARVTRERRRPYVRPMVSELTQLRAAQLSVSVVDPWSSGIIEYSRPYFVGTDEETPLGGRIPEDAIYERLEKANGLLTYSLCDRCSKHWHKHRRSSIGLECPGTDA